MNLNIEELENTLIICPNDYKNRLLESFSNEKKIIDVSFMSLQEYIKNYFFDYGIEAIKYLTQEGLSVDNAKEVLNNLYYVENKKYNNEKLDVLVEYKKKLDKENLLIYNKLFKSYINSKNIVVLGYGKLNNYELSLFEGKTIKIIEEESVNKIYTIKEFANIEDEVENLYNNIYDLLEDGIDINNIYVTNASKDYEAYFNRYNTYYGFEIKYVTNSYIVGTTQAETFVSMIDTNSKEEIYEYLVKQNDEVSDKLINILNKYTKYNLVDVKDLIINDLKNTTITKEYKNVVNCSNIMSQYDDSDYVFVIGFNDTIPTTTKDTDYITDNIKHLVNLPLIEEINEIKKQNTKTHLSNINNLYLSYSKNSPFNTFNKQTLLTDEECKYINIENTYEYSEKLNKAKYADKLDKLRKFNDNDKQISELNNTYGRNNYLSYNNKFKGLSDKQVENITKQINRKDELTLSYSSMNNFFECNFKYYLDAVLKIKEPFGTYYTKLGTVCHGVLEELYNNPNFEFEKAWENEINKEEDKEKAPIFEDEGEKYFVERIKEELRKDIEVVKTQKQSSELNKEKCENNFTIKVDDRINFTGFIDKVMYKETDNEILASIVDYKTSKSIEIDKDIMKYGLSLQLPSYLFLMKYAKNFNKEIKFAGFYIQHIINYDNKYKQDKTLDQTKAESMKLDGISSNSPDRLMALDLTLAENKKSDTIKGISLNKDDSLRKSPKLYSDEQFDELIELVEKNIKLAGETILKGDFSINPKQIDKQNKSCEYCKYAAICYKRATDLVFLSKEEQ